MTRTESGPQLSIGARVLKPSELIGLQSQALASIINAIHDVGRSDTGSPSSSDWELNRPRHVHLIDGARGSGKTSTLLTVRRYAQVIAGVIDDSSGDERTGILDSNDSLKRCWTDLRAKKPFFLPMINTAGLDSTHSSMEAQLSFMLEYIREKIDQADKDGIKRHSDRLRALQKTLVSRVIKGWQLSREEGRSIVAQESASFEDFNKRNSDASIFLHNRIVEWRKFVDQFLIEFDFKCLVIMFDDADVNPEVTEDILYTIRLFFNHPDIVTIIASNIRTLRNVLLKKRFAEVAVAAPATSGARGTTARDLRNIARIQVEEYLEKVLPRQNRIFLKLESISAGPSGVKPNAVPSRNGENPSDFSRIFGQNFPDIDRFSSAVLHAYLKDFILAKAAAHQRWLKNEYEPGTADDVRNMERFISWWLFRHFYHRQLLPNSLRHLNVFRDLFLPVANGEVRGFDKRLVANLYDNPENVPFLSRLGDRDGDFLSWLRKQPISSTWIGNRSFKIADWEIPEGDYAYDFLRYRIDLGIAMPLRLNRSLVIPHGILPTPAGPDLAGWGPFLKGVEDSKRHGIAETINHSLIPSNCIYMFDLACLPDVTWSTASNPAADLAWNWHLTHDWARLFYQPRPWSHDTDLDNNSKGTPFELVVEALNELNSTELSFDIKPDKYFIERVLPVASLATSSVLPRRPMKSEPHSIALLSKYGDVMKQVCTKITDMHFENFTILQHIDNPAQGDRVLQRETIKSILGKLKRKDGSIITIDEDKKTIIYITDTVSAINNKFRRSGYVDMTDTLVRAEWLVNDLKKAWLSFRIFLNQVPEIVKYDGISIKKFDGRNHESDSEELIRDSSRRKALFSRDDRFLTSLGIRYIMERWIAPAESLFITLKRCRTWEGIVDIDQSETIRHYVLGRVQLRNNAFYDENSKERKTITLNENDFIYEVIRNISNKISEEMFWTESDSPKSPDEERRTGFFNAVISEQANMARLLRCYFCFVYALSSTLPSLIHLEIFNAFYSQESESVVREGKKYLKTLLQCWKEFVKSLLSFVQWYEDFIEFCVFTIQVGGEAAAVSARMTAIPDISFGSIGAGGISGYGFTPKDKSGENWKNDKDPPDSLAAWDIGELKKGSDADSSREFEAYFTYWKSSMFGRTQINLIETLKYIESLIPSKARTRDSGVRSGPGNSKQAVGRAGKRETAS